MPDRAVTSLSRELGLPGHGPDALNARDNLAEARHAAATGGPGERWHEPEPGLCMGEVGQDFAKIFAEHLELAGRVQPVQECELRERIAAVS